MNSKNSLMHASSQSMPRALPVREQERSILAVGEAHQWGFRVLGVAPVPQTALYAHDWWLVPLHEDTSAIPARSLERVRAIYAAGIRPKAFLIAHEAPKQIAPPSETRIVSPAEYWTKRAGDGALTVLKAAGQVASMIVPVLVTVLGAGLMLSLTFVGAVAAAALVADPCLIAVTEDDVWIQLDYWMA